MASKLHSWAVSLLLVALFASSAHAADTAIIGPYRLIQNSGTDVQRRSTLNIVGQGLMTCADGSNKTDCSVLTPVRGDILRGNATPAWERLAKGSTGQYLRSSATDVLWSGLLLSDATNQGTATQLLHGGDPGAVSFGALVVADLSDDLVTYAKLQNVSATDRLLGRDTAAAGDIEELTVGGGLEFTGSGGIQRSALTGGDVTASAASAVATIANDAVTYAKLQNISATSRILGRITTGAGDTEELTAANVATILGTSLDLYALLGGRSGGQTLIGGTATGDHLTLDANTQAYAVGNAGRIIVQDRVVQFPGNMTFGSGVNAMYMVGDGTPTYTLDTTSSILEGFLMTANVTVAANNPFGPISWVSYPRDIRYTVAQTSGTHPYFFRAGPVFIADNVDVKMDGGTGFVDNPFFQVVGSGTYNAVSTWRGYYSGPTVSTGASFDLRYGLLVDDVLGAGSLANNVGISIAALAKGGTRNTAIESLGTTADLRFAGPMRVGATGAPMATFDLDVQGKAQLDGAVVLWPTQPQPSAATEVLTWAPTFTMTGAGFPVFMFANLAPTLTYDVTVGNGRFFNAVSLGGTFTTIAGNGGAGISTLTLFVGSPTLTSAATALPPAKVPAVFQASPTFRATDNDVGTIDSYIGFYESGLVRAEGTTDAKITLTDYYSFRSVPNCTALTGDAGRTCVITNRYGFRADDVTIGAGTGTRTITNNVGVDVVYFVNGTTKIGIRNASSTVYTPSTIQTVTTGTGVSPNATVVLIQSTGNVELPAAAVTDGVDGQLLYIVGGDSNADIVTFTEGDNLELGAATRLVTAGDVLTLLFSTNRADWIEVSYVSND